MAPGPRDTLCPSFHGSRDWRRERYKIPPLPAGLPELKAAWQEGRKELFYPYGKTYAKTLGEQD